ncbi:MAG TPA: DctP family TRAP transporter solute-binding subunit [Beijerinckiaceae bacterium]|nr:DctP family TRAP transporter solute-binding subunit [Beijerinckiaceae bacterium]
MTIHRRMLLAGSVAIAALFSLPALAQQVTLKYAHFQPARDDQPKHKAALAFKEHVEKATKGSVSVQIFPAGQFGNDAATMEGLKLGTLEMAVAHDGAISTVYRPVGILGIPFMFESHAHAWAVYDSAWRDEFGAGMTKATGIRLLEFADNGIRHFTNSKAAISSPADMKGMKMRIQPSPVFRALVESLGASASAIPWAELPTALQSKVVDGQENGVSNILAASLFQYQKFVSLTGHVYSSHAYLVNDAFFSKLTADQQKAVREGAVLARDIHRKMTSDQDKDAKRILTEKGLTVTELSAAQIAEFRKLAQPPVVEWANKEIGKEHVDALLKAVDANRPKS